jgi:hypothetical protein
MYCDGSADQFDSFRVTPTLIGNDSQQMQCVCVTRIDIEDFPVKIFGIVQPAGSMMLKRFCLPCLHARRLPFP